MNKLFLEILNSQYKDWIMFSIPFILAAIATLIKYVKKSIGKRKKKKNLPWIGRIDGINKNNKRNI